MGKSLEVKNLVFMYGDRLVLDGISFKVHSGSMLTIIGPNGSGKSTLLRNLATHLVPREGDIFLDNKDIRSYSLKELAKEIAVVPQNTSIEYNFTAYEIVLMGRNPYLKRFKQETGEDLTVVRQSMEKTNTWKLKDRDINELSGGERQRVILARALAQEPNILLLDEPTAALDIHQQIEILDLLKRLNEEKGVTIVMVLHDINLAARYSRDILLLKEGRKITMGSPETVITKDNLQKIYPMDMVVEKNKHTNSPQVVPLSTLKKL